MDKYIINRIMEEAVYIINTKSTVREVANIYKVSKSTVHKDLKERLRYIDKDLYKKIKIIFINHIQTRHIKGGEATRQKYLKKGMV